MSRKEIFSLKKQFLKNKTIHTLRCKFNWTADQKV